MTDRVDTSGVFVCENHAVVTFTFDRITALSLEDTDTDGIVGSLQVIALPGGSGRRVVWDNSWGVWGWVEGRGLSLELTPGEPSINA